jgi:hypothetical protein
MNLARGFTPVLSTFLNIAVEAANYTRGQRVLLLTRPRLGRGTLGMHILGAHFVRLCGFPTH